MVLDVRPEAASCTGVVKIYWTATGEVHALKGIDAEFPGGAITAVVGPSGSGKSSLLRILACIDRPTAGQVKLGGTDVAGMKPGRRRHLRKRLIGYMFQRPAENLISYLTAMEHLEMAARLRGASADDEGPELLDALGLRARADHRPNELSGGEQQRLALASAVIGGPSLVLADEPTAELDSESAKHLMNKVVELRDRGLSFVVATHDPVAMKVADVILHLRHGTMEAETSEDRLLSVIDAFGRIQLPPVALRLFPDRRAVVSFDDGEVRITPP
jgi:ABC-type lipoprotein export system ATPase subunit